MFWQCLTRTENERGEVTPNANNQHCEKASRDVRGGGWLGWPRVC